MQEKKTWRTDKWAVKKHTTIICPSAIGIYIYMCNIIYPSWWIPLWVILYYILFEFRSPYRRVLFHRSLYFEFLRAIFRVIIYDVPAGFNRMILLYTRVIYYYYYHVYVSIARIIRVYNTLHAFIIHVCFFFVAVVIFRPAQLFIGNISFISGERERFTMMELYLFYSFFFSFGLLSTAFVIVERRSVCIKKS